MSMLPQDSTPPPHGGKRPTAKVALVPLDERPVNTRYPEMLAQIAGATVLLPPADLLPDLRRPAPSRQALAQWLVDAARQSEAVLVSVDMLAYGGLIASRTTDDSALDVLSFLSVLPGVNETCPVHAFGTVTRAPAVNHAFEEPAYWAEHGERLALWGRRFHEAGLVEEDAVPPDLRADWVGRRLRNHAVTLALLDMAARGLLTSLAVLSDDTSPFGLPSRERTRLASWPALVGEPLQSRLSMHPGADEAASAGVARLLAGDRKPRILVRYAIPEDAERVAPYEDRPVRETVAGQIAACGGIVVNVARDADFVLGVVPPVPGRREYKPAYLEENRAARDSVYQAFVSQLAAWQSAGLPIALADVAYPNGADPLLMEHLLSEGCPLRLETLMAFGAWNTAGNTLGTTVAQGVCAFLGGGRHAQAQHLFLAHRFLEDWGYQSVVRREARAWAQDQWGRSEPSPDSVEEQSAIREFIAARLTECQAQLQARGIGNGLTLTNVRLPWRRLFEVDFTLQTEV